MSCLNKLFSFFNKDESTEVLTNPLEHQEEYTQKVICLYGKNGTGKSNAISKLKIDKSKTILLDLKNDLFFQKGFLESRIISADTNSMKESLEELEKEIAFDKPKFIIIDDAQALLRDDLIETFKDVFDFSKDLKDDTVFILGTQEKISIGDINIDYFEIKNLIEVENTVIDINLYLKNITKKRG